MTKLGAPVSPPPPLVDDDFGGGSDWVALLRADNDIDAHLLTGRLADAGVETRMMADRSQSAAWLFGGSNPWAPVLVMVRRFQYEDARIVLAEISLDAAPAEPGTLSTGGGVRRPVLWWVLALSLGLFFTGVSLANATHH